MCPQGEVDVSPFAGEVCLSVAADRKSGKIEAWVIEGKDDDGGGKTG